MTGFFGGYCPSCFRQTLINGKCAECGYVYDENAYAGAPLKPFTQLHHKYILGKVLGEGGFGITYIAKNTATGRLCCVKEYFPAELVKTHDAAGRVNVTDPSRRGEYVQGMRRFMEEARTLQDLKGNVAVVNIEEQFEENGTAYFAMELLDGCNLRAFQRTHAPKQNYSMAIQMLFLIGSALAEVHRFGFIHGDISPENIIITNNGEIKLIDFGAARSFAHQNSGQKGKIYLKPNYAPYEQYSLKPYQGPWTDIYALAATFYIIISGQHMLDAPSRAKGMQYTPLCRLSPLVSSELSDVMDHALAFDYHERYSSAMEFLNDLDKVTSQKERSVDLRQYMPRPAVNSVPHVVEAKSEHSNEENRLVDDIYQAKRGGFFPWQKKRTSMAYLVLTVANHGTRKWILPANKVQTIGRLGTCEIMMPSDENSGNVSRTHCKIYYDERKRYFILRDDKSKYGTYLRSGERMLHGREYILKSGDEFYIVKPYYSFKLLIEE